MRHRLLSTVGHFGGAEAHRQPVSVPVVARRWLVAVALAILLPAVIGMRLSGHSRAPVTPHAHASALSVAARLAVSRGLGADLAEYRLTRGPDGFRARNPHEDMTASFGGRGATVDVGSGERASIALQAIGSGAVLHNVGRAEPLARANRVEYRRGGITEWFANGPAGVEQGFTIARQPAGTALGALTLDLGVSGTLTARPGTRGDLVLAGAGGKAVLRYGELSVTDAAGKSLPAHMTAEHGHVLISVETRGARYPLTVDPLIQDAELTASKDDGTYGFGFSVASDGGTIVVGSPEVTVGATAAQGAAFVFTKPLAGWSGSLNEVAELTSNAAGAYSNFGWSVAISGGTIVVGARNVGVNFGAVYEFTEPVGGWTGTLQPTATLGPGAFSYDLGYSVAISGSTVVAGAPDAETTGGGEHQGLVEVFKEPVGGWAGTVGATANFTSSAAEQNYEEFGDAVAISGHTIVVGAPGAIIPGSPQQANDTETGTAYVFSEPGGGWVGSDAPAAALTDGTVGDKLGMSLALDGEATVFADAPCAPNGCNTNAGGAGVIDFYSKPGGGWASTSTPTGQLTDSAGHEPSDLGESIAADGTTVVAGAPLGGFVDVFDEPAGGWESETQSGQFLAPSKAFDLGFAVGISEETPVASAFLHNSHAEPASGAAFVFGLPLPAPTVVTESAGPVGETTATLTGTVNPNGLNVTGCDFEWGTSGSYGNLAPCSSAPGASTSAVAVSASLTGLDAGETYYYRLVATNSTGTNKGSPKTLTTSSKPATEPEKVKEETKTSTISTTTTGPPNAQVTNTQTTVVTPAAAALACGTAQVALIDVVPQGSHVLITGAARQILAGKDVSIKLIGTKKIVATPKVEADGSFNATVPLPPARIRNTNLARYEASVGSDHSEALKLDRRAYLISATRSANNVLISGKATAPFKEGTPVQITLRVTCQTYRMVGKAKLSASGDFTATVPAPTAAEQAIAVYRAHTTVLKGKHPEPTYTLPTPPTGT
jgi:FG-GAP repeat